MSHLAALRQPVVGPLTGAQLFTALGDNALLIVAIALLEQEHAASWMSPALRICLYLSYVVLAPLAGTLADRLPKGRVIVLVNLVKAGGAMLLCAGAQPLIVFGVIGIAGVCYGPAKYGILAELVPAGGLVEANAWIEVATVSAILGGAALGAASLAAPLVLPWLPTVTRQASLLVAPLFAVAALWSLAIPPTACRASAPGRPLARFGHQLSVLWQDPHGKVSLLVTSLFWAVAAVLQFLVIRWAQEALGLTVGGAALLQCCLAIGVVAGSLGVARWVAADAALRVLPAAAVLQFLVIRWAREALGLTVGGAALLQCCLAIGVVAGSLGVARWVAADTALRVLPAAAVLGSAIMMLSLVTQLWLACAALFAAGILAGIVMVPMNALLQQRGHALMQSGASIAVQSFCENFASLAFLAAYGLLLAAAMPVKDSLIGLGILTTVSVLMVLQRSRGLTRCAV